MDNGNYEARFERIERALENLVDSQRQLLTGQVVMVDSVDKLAGRVEQVVITVDKLAGRVEQVVITVDNLGKTVDNLGKRVDQLTIDVGELKESQKHTDERLNALIAVVDDIVRNRKRPPLQ